LNIFMTAEWYCKRTWSPANRDDFFRRLERSRSAYHKAQYVVIQAETLKKTKKREALLVALELLDLALTKWPKDVQTVRAQYAIAECYVALGDFPRAVEAHRQVIETQRRHPYWLMPSPVEFAWLVAALPMPKFYKEALAAMEEFPRDYTPSERFMTNASSALILAARGQKEKAVNFAQAALNETGSKNTLGLPKTSYEKAVKTVRKLAASQITKSKPKLKPGRKMKLQDKALSELGQMFASPELMEDDPTPGAELLDSARLDFSIKSLKFVDDYLAKMRKRRLVENSEDYCKLVLRCGAYVGEVVLRNSNSKGYHWLDWKGALKINKDIADFGESIGGAAVLWDSNDRLIFPLSKVQKFLDNGREDSVQFFAKVMA